MTPGPAPGRAADRARTIFLGSGSFAVPILDGLARHHRVELVAAVTAPDRPAGRRQELRPTPVGQRAAELGLAVLKPARVRAPEAIAEIGALEPGIGVLADYGQIIPPALLALPARGILNVHPSLLPRHRGATPIQAAIAEGDDRTGVTVIHMDEGIDTGPIVTTVGWNLTGSERAPDLEAFAAEEASELLERRLGPFLDGMIAARPQPDAGASVTRTLRREDGRLDPARPAAELERHVRAYLPWPGSFIDTTAGRLVVTAARVAPSLPGDEPGRLVRHDDRPALATADGRLVLDELQLAGRRSMAGPDALRGHPELASAIVEPPAAEPPAAEPAASRG